TQLSTTPDRTYGLLTHPTIPALASALAVADMLGASGAQFLEAFLTGFEVECKISEAINPDHYNKGFHSTGTIGTFAAAAAMLKLVGDHNITPDQVKGVVVRAGSNILEPLRYKTAKTELEAKFCIPFLMTSMILRRKAGIREFTDEFVSSDAVQRMMPLVETKFDPEIEAKGFDRIRCVVHVSLKDGRSFV